MAAAVQGPSNVASPHNVSKAAPGVRPRAATDAGSAESRRKRLLSLLTGAVEAGQATPADTGDIFASPSDGGQQSTATHAKLVDSDGAGSASGAPAGLRSLEHTGLFGAPEASGAAVASSARVAALIAPPRTRTTQSDESGSANTQPVPALQEGRNLSTSSAVSTTGTARGNGDAAVGSSDTAATVQEAELQAEPVAASDDVSSDVARALRSLSTAVDRLTVALHGATAMRACQPLSLDPQSGWARYFADYDLREAVGKVWTPACGTCGHQPPPLALTRALHTRMSPRTWPGRTQVYISFKATG